MINNDIHRVDVLGLKDNGEWGNNPCDDLIEDVFLESVNLTIPMNRIYKKVKLKK